MRSTSIKTVITILLTTLTTLNIAHPASSSASQVFLSNLSPNHANQSPNISTTLFNSLEEFSRIVDISYCVGLTGAGISKPFQCASRCDDFPNFELVDTFNTGPLMSDSCGYVVLDHGAGGGEGMDMEGTEGIKKNGRIGKKGRIIVAFRGTYSIANTIVDLSTVPQEYVPYPEDPDSSTVPMRQHQHRFLDWIPWLRSTRNEDGDVMKRSEEGPKCHNCSVHSGFWTSWKNTRPYVLPHLNVLRQIYPDYELHLVGHSLGGAVAALAGLELEGRKWKPTVTTFGEPQIGNKGLRDYLDGVFGLGDKGLGYAGEERRYRRVTHVDDPVPLLPLREWGYVSHAGEVFIEKAELQPEVGDLRLCFGDEDGECIGGDGGDGFWFGGLRDVNANANVDGNEYKNGNDDGNEDENEKAEIEELRKRWGLPIPTRFKLWQLFFAHRDYFWRLGLCLPGGDPLDWNRPKYNITEEGDGVGAGFGKEL